MYGSSVVVPSAVLTLQSENGGYCHEQLFAISYALLVPSSCLLYFFAKLLKPVSECNYAAILCSSCTFTDGSLKPCYIICRLW